MLKYQNKIFYICLFSLIACQTSKEGVVSHFDCYSWPLAPSQLNVSSLVFHKDLGGYIAKTRSRKLKTGYEFYDGDIDDVDIEDLYLPGDLSPDTSHLGYGVFQGRKVLALGKSWQDTGLMVLVQDFLSGQTLFSITLAFKKEQDYQVLFNAKGMWLLAGEKGAIPSKRPTSLFLAVEKGETEKRLFFEKKLTFKGDVKIIHKDHAIKGLAYLDSTLFKKEKKTYLTYIDLQKTPSKETLDSFAVEYLDQWAFGFYGPHKLFAFEGGDSFIGEAFLHVKSYPKGKSPLELGKIPLEDDEISSTHIVSSKKPLIASLLWKGDKGFLAIYTPHKGSFKLQGKYPIQSKEAALSQAFLSPKGDFNAVIFSRKKRFPHPQVCQLEGN